MRKKNETQQDHRNDNVGERGAALVMALLVSVLLLAAGGALIIATSNTSANMFDATAEAQAYYAAEAGLQASLNALRGHRPAQNPVAATGEKMNFRLAMTPVTSNAIGDTSTVANVARLSRWLPYASNGTGARVTFGTNLQYDVQVDDASLLDNIVGVPPTFDNDTRLGLQPARLRIRVNGYGPKGARKRLDAIYRRTKFEFNAPSTITLISARDCSTMTADIGSSEPKKYSGEDKSGFAPTLPSVATTCTGNTTDIVDDKDSLLTPKATLAPSALDEWLRTPDGCRALLQYLQAEAAASGVLTSVDFDGVSNDFKFVDGNCDLEGGSGLLVVTGTLRMHGNPSFNGLILVLGGGRVERDGGGEGVINGAMVVSQFARTWDAADDDPAIDNNVEYPFLTPHFETNGGGKSRVQYDSLAIQNALDFTGPLVLGVREL